jgi:phage terminase small subunit
MATPRADINEYGLNHKQEAFCVAIASGMSQIDAYRQAFPTSRKWKDSAVYPKASILAATDKIKARIEVLLSKAAKANDVTIERIVRELALIAFGSKRDVMAWGPDGVTMKDSKTLTEEQAAIVSEVKSAPGAQGVAVSLKTHDKVKALELLGRHVGMFSDKVEVTGKDGKDLYPSLDAFYGKP